jgi:hypothetical protein
MAFLPLVLEVPSSAAAGRALASGGADADEANGRLHVLQLLDLESERDFGVDFRGLRFGIGLHVSSAKKIFQYVDESAASP